MEITIGNLVDQLVVCNLKIWHLEDIKRSLRPATEIAEATRKTNILNEQRNLLIQAIDEATGQKHFGQGETKMYGK